ncbi:MAG: NAD-dependent epimerase/dehydratase family protein [Myxococcales bacterium]|nr:NAD-dependent epimerase/dehydratase family protein [Myxococcales bacterium]
MQKAPQSAAVRKTVWLTGASGFIGRHLTSRLQARDDLRLLTPTRAQLDLSDPQAVTSFIQTTRPDAVIHLAAKTAGSAAMRAAPMQFFSENLASATPLIRAVEQGLVAKVVLAGSAGEYPRLVELGQKARGLQPDDLWRGPPAAGGYGMARRSISQLLCDAASVSGSTATVLVLPTVYGPGDGGLGPIDTARLRALPAFACRMLAAMASGERTVSHFGSGFEMRDFLHVTDAARAFEAAVFSGSASGRLHVTSGEPVEMRTLAKLVAAAAGYDGKHKWSGRTKGQRTSTDRVWLAPAGDLSLGEMISLEAGLSGVITDLKARLA